MRLICLKHFLTLFACSLHAIPRLKPASPSTAGCCRFYCAAMVVAFFSKTTRLVLHALEDETFERLDRHGHRTAAAAAVERVDAALGVSPLSLFSLFSRVHVWGCNLEASSRPTTNNTVNLIGVEWDNQTIYQSIHQPKKKLLSFVSGTLCTISICS